MTAGVDPAPAAARPRRFLHGLNPLAALAAPLPAIVALVFSRDAATPAAFLVLAVLILLVGARPSRRLLAALLALPVVVVVLGLGFSLWTDPAAVAQTPVVWEVGGWQVRSGALAIGFSTGLRLAAIVALSLVPGLSIDGTDLIRASVQQLRVPYRVGYTALAALRFVPRFGHELEVIRQAHRVRGAHAGRGPVAAAGRWWGYMIPLLAGAIRHAERVALAMDARAFGAHPDRTERHLVPFRPRDVVFVALSWAATVVLFTVL